MTHRRLMYLLLIASLIAFAFACTHGVHVNGGGGGRGMSDGGGL